MELEHSSAMTNIYVEWPLLHIDFNPLRGCKYSFDMMDKDFVTLTFSDTSIVILLV